MCGSPGQNLNIYAYFKHITKFDMLQRQASAIWGSYMLHRRIRYLCIYIAYEPHPQKKVVVKLDDALRICDGIYSSSIRDATYTACLITYLYSEYINCFIPCLCFYYTCRFANLSALGFEYYFNPCHIYFDVRCNNNVYVRVSKMLHVYTK